MPDGAKSKKVLGELKKQLRSGLGLPNGKSKTELGGHGEVKKLSRHKWITADYPTIICSRMPPTTQIWSVL